MKSSKICLLAALLLVLPLSSQAQGLTGLSRAPEIKVGEFPNGITYYLVTNKAAYGYADYALVQKGVPEETKFRGELLSLNHFDGQKPYQFLATRGVGYKSCGYVKRGEDYTMYRFEDVPTSDVASSDTTLMMLFDLSELCPTEQAIIISGDIDASAIQGKMSVFSLMVSKREPAPVTPAYIWEPQPGSEIITTTNHFQRVSSVTARFATPRTAAKHLNTVQTIVSDMMFAELDLIVGERIRHAFRTADIPLGDLVLARKKASDGPGDEAWTAQVFVGREDVEGAIETLADVFANLETAGISEAELQDARDQYLARLNKTAFSATTSNAEYLDKCAAAYLYGTDLAPATAARDYLGKRQLPIGTATEIFNQFVSALLDKEENLTLTVDAPGVPFQPEEIDALYASAWSRPQQRVYYRPHFSDTLALSGPSGRIKMKLEATEPVTGGVIWHFSNGMKVIYKKAETAGQFQYAFLFRGGFSSVPGLKKGEGAFVSDILGFYDVAGKSCTDFNQMLKANGITMERNVNVADMVLTGTAPTGKLPLLLASVLSLTKDRTFNAEEYDYYLRSEKLRLERERMMTPGILATTDLALRPDYLYTPYKYSDNLSDDLPRRAESYFARQFAKADDGIISLVGDLDPLTAQKVLCKYLDGFKTSKGLSQRPQAQYSLRSGWVSLTDEGAHAEDASVHFSLTSMLPVTAERYYAFRIAELILQKRMSVALAGCGYWSSLESGMEIYPRERWNLLLSCRPAATDGLPSGVEPADPAVAVGIIRSALEEALKQKVSASELKIYKDLLLKQATYEMGRPDAIQEAIIARYSYGKDLSSKYKTLIPGLKAAAVEECLADLAGSGKVEYVVTK
ncbi:MAG: insulinase family protein [Bacteroidales bacterium]|nr:insulinase family protein [Bacteroidales bacterium]